MDDQDQFGTAIPTIKHLRDVVRPLPEKMVSKHSPPYADLLTRADRDELVGNVLEKYFTKWGRSEGPEKLGAWLKPVVKATIVDELRRRGVRREQLADLAEPDDADARLNAALGDMATPSLITHHKMLLFDALEEVAKKHPEEPELIRLRYEAGLSVAEIADRLGENEETVKKRIQRATGRLRDVETDLLPNESE